MSNIIAVPKKDNKIRVCVDFRDLNKEVWRMNSLYPHIDVLMDNAAKSSTFSFMDGFSKYNKIKLFNKIIITFNSIVKLDSNSSDSIGPILLEMVVCNWPMFAIYN